MEVGDIIIHFKKGQPERQQEALIIATNTETLRISNMKAGHSLQQHTGHKVLHECRSYSLCKFVHDTIQHITAGCNTQTLTAYAERYNQVVEMLR